MQTDFSGFQFLNPYKFTKRSFGLRAIVSLRMEMETKIVKFLKENKWLFFSFWDRVCYRG